MNEYFSLYLFLNKYFYWGCLPVEDSGIMFNIFLGINDYFYNPNCIFGLYTEFFLLIYLSNLICLFVILDKFFNYKFILVKISGNLFILGLLLTLIIESNTINSLSFDYLFFNDNLSSFIKIMILITMIFVVLISFNYLSKEKIIQYEYFLLIGLALLGTLTIVVSNDLISMYLAIELQSLSFYILAAFKTFDNYSTEAGLKYFILGAFSSGLLLLGCSFIYGYTGTTNFTNFYFLLYNNSISMDIFGGLVLGVIFISVGIFFKLGIAPFHMWLPDVYDGVPSSITLIFAIIPKVAIISLFLRLSINLFSNSLFLWYQILIYTAILSIIVGTLGALYQSKLKRVIAYSAISHAGFILIGFLSLTNYSIFSLYFYIIIYIIISLNIFSIILNIRKVDNNNKIKKINELALLFKSNKALSFNFLILLFSIAGIPPLVGFYSKFYIFVSAIKNELYLVAIIAAIFSVIASMYYIRLIKIMFFKDFKYWFFLHEINKISSIVMSLICFFNILFFLYPELFVIYIYNIILNFLY